MDNHEQEVSEIVSVELSQFEGRQLFEFLARLVEQTGAEFNLDALEAAQDKLGDANALALWLRENVALNLRPTEAIELLEALLAKPEEDGHPQEGGAALAAVADKLSACLRRDLAANP